VSRRGYPRYVPVAERRAKAERKQKKLRAAGRDVKPVRITGAIAKSFWGKAWCANLEAYSDYSNRLPRGRMYARNGSILDLQIAKGRIDALVSGSRLYTVALQITPVEAKRWSRIRSECAGQIGSLVELLQGKLSTGVMGVVTQPGSGLLPGPEEIELSCSCPDWATMCKHVAAVLYGAGARLDDEPEMLFALRGIDPAEMLEEAIDLGVPERQARGRVLLEVDDLSSVFGVDIDFSEEAREETVNEAAVEPEEKALAEKEAVASSTTDTVLAMIEAEPGLRTPELAERLGVPRSAVVRAVARLKEWGLVGFVGPRRSGGYRPID